jgi:hypothetical protein
MLTMLHFVVFTSVRRLESDCAAQVATDAATIIILSKCSFVQQLPPNSEVAYIVEPYGRSSRWKCSRVRKRIYLHDSKIDSFNPATILVQKRTIAAVSTSESPRHPALG